jgi:class 3 adenylate cyclase
VNDATDMAATLQQLGFEVTLLHDTDLRTMQTALQMFSQRLRQGGMGLFYFAGQGVQISGDMYLIPLGARLEQEQDIQHEALPVGRVGHAMSTDERRIQTAARFLFEEHHARKSFARIPELIAPHNALQVGINTGPVMVCSVGNNLCMDDKAAANTVNLAALHLEPCLLRWRREVSKYLFNGFG